MNRIVALLPALPAALILAGWACAIWARHLARRGPVKGGKT